MTINKVFGSSADPTELALTFKGILVGLVPIAMIAVRAAGHDISQDQLKELVETVTNIVAAGGALASAMMVALGVVRKVWLAFKNKK